MPAIRQAGGSSSARPISPAIVNADVDAAAAITYAKLALSNGIVNGDINASAAIAYSKLALGASVVNADVANAAAIAYSKLALTGSIVNADVAGAAAIARSKLDFGSGLVNADVAAAAAIAYSKLALTGSILAADLAVTNFAPSGLTGATQASRYVGATTSGAPASGTFAVGDYAIDRAGKTWLCVTAGTPGTWTNPGLPRAQAANTTRGILAEPYPFGPSGSNTNIPTAGAANGTVQLCLVGLRAGDTVTNIVCPVSVNGTSLSFAKFGIYDSTGAFLKATAECSATMNGAVSNTWQTIALTSTYTATADGGYYLGYLQFGSGATGATLYRASTGVTVQTIAAPTVRMFATVAAQTDLSGNLTLANAATNALMYLACS